MPATPTKVMLLCKPRMFVISHREKHFIPQKMQDSKIKCKLCSLGSDLEGVRRNLPLPRALVVNKKRLDC